MSPIVIVLAIETSVRYGNIALLQQASPAEQPVTTYRDLPIERRTTQCLVTEIQRLLHERKTALAEVDLFAVSKGPGSFTGLRIGMVVAKTLAYATKKDVLSIPTFDILASACNPRSIGDQLSLIIDAQRQQLFQQTRIGEADSWGITEDFQLVERTDWCASLPDQAQIAGPGLEAFKGKSAAQLAECLAARPKVLRQHAQPRADVLARLAYERFRKGEREEAWGMLPLYGRRSAAEEKHKVKE